MQKDTLAPPPPAPLASNTAQGEGRQASTSGAPSKNETGRLASPQTRRKPSISKVILGVVTDKGMHNCVSLATLKKAVTAMGYDMTWNAWRFKRVLKGLVDKGVLKQVTGKGALGSFRMGKKLASKFKLGDERQRQSGQRRPGQRRPGQHRPGKRRPGQRRSGQRRSGKRRPGQRRSGQRRPGQRRLLVGSQRGHKQLRKEVRRVAKCRRN